jgi:hypothetical protein
MSALDPITITATETSFTRMARKYREPDEMARWLKEGSPNGAHSGSALPAGDEEVEAQELAGAG